MSILFIILISLLSCEGAKKMEENPSKDKIKSVLKDYVESADQRDLKLADKSMHKSFTQYLDFMGSGIGRSDRELYKQMLSSKKIGGEKRSFKIETIDIVDQIAFAKLVITSPTLIFYDYVTLMKDKNTDWSIVSITLTVCPNKKN